MEEQIDSLEYAQDNPALYRLEEELLSYARKDGANDSTRYISSLPNREMPETRQGPKGTFILDTVGDCDDDNFTQPM